MEGGGGLGLGLCRVTGPPLCRVRCLAGTARNGWCTRMSGTCVACVTCAGCATMTWRGGGGGHRKVCRDTCRDMRKLLGTAVGPRFIPFLELSPLTCLVGPLSPHTLYRSSLLE